jgi:DNA repair protein RecN (Recombination protein N)
LLVDLHQQFDTLELAQKDFQLEVLDALASQFSLLDEYQVLYVQWQELRKLTNALREQQLQFERESDYHQFQYNELKELSLKENELEDIEGELKLLNNAEDLSKALSKATFELLESESPIVQQLKILTNQLSAYSSLHSGLHELLERLKSAQVELQDIAGSLDQISRHINFDPPRIEQLNERLSLGYKLLKKMSWRKNCRPFLK